MAAVYVPSTLSDLYCRLQLIPDAALVEVCHIGSNCEKAGSCHFPGLFHTPKNRLDKRVRRRFDVILQEHSYRR